MDRVIFSIVFAFALLASPLSSSAQTTGCQYILGFQTLHDLDPTDVGACTDNQAFAANGDAQQHTNKGLMAWRKLDNWTAFTNGYLTWINGPRGLVKRLNAQRFTWEDNPDNLPFADTPDRSCGHPPGVVTTYPEDPRGKTVDFAASGGNFHAQIEFVAETRDLLSLGNGCFPPGTPDMAVSGNGILAVFLLKVTNVGDTTGTLYQTELSAHDAQGRTFTYGDVPVEDQFFLAKLYVRKGVADKLGPSLTDGFVIAYDVARDSTGLTLVPSS